MVEEDAALLEHDDDVFLCDDDCVSDVEHMPEVVLEPFAEASPAAVPMDQQCRQNIRGS